MTQLVLVDSACFAPDAGTALAASGCALGTPAAGIADRDHLTDLLCYLGARELPVHLLHHGARRVPHRGGDESRGNPLLAPVVGALLDDEREEYLAERGSRKRLHAIVVSALVDGPVVVHACWAGDEGLAPVAVEEVDASWLLKRTSPLKEGVQYRVTHAGP